jgi:two-component system chemotaxis response regulator CheY
MVDIEINTIQINDVLVDSHQNFLVIDDEGDILEVIEAFIIGLGFQGKIHKAINIHEAKRHLKYEKIDYIVSDWNLPDGEGIALLKAIRKSYKFRDIPFLMITGDTSIESMILSQQYGSSDYLTKPFSLEQFTDKLALAWKTHILPKKEEFHQLRQKIVDLQEEIEYLKDRLKTK